MKGRWWPANSEHAVIGLLLIRTANPKIPECADIIDDNWIDFIHDIVNICDLLLLPSIPSHMSETDKAKPSAGLSDLLDRTKKYADVREKVDKEYGQLTNTLSETLALEERAELEVKANFESLQQAIQERNGAVEALSRVVLFRTDVNKREKELLAAMAAVILEKGKSKLLSGDVSDTIPTPKDVEQQQAIEKESENEEEGETKVEEEQSDEKEKGSDEEVA
uniref:Uncharacterized protein n=1 Tax=Globodera rostochiensis TaxID=31243 RepID=A0A914IBD8_GLORO